MQPSLCFSIFLLPFLKYVITSNGATIYDAVEQKNIIENFLTPEAVDAVIEIAKELPVITEYFIDGKAYIAKAVYDDLTPFELTESHEAYIKNSRTPVEDFWLMRTTSETRIPASPTRERPGSRMISGRFSPKSSRK